MEHMELQHIADWFFKVQASIEVCKGEIIDERFLIPEVLRAGSAQKFILYLEKEGKLFEASLVARFFKIPTTAVLTAEVQKSFDAFWALVPTCPSCKACCPELADVLDKQLMVCNACDFFMGDYEQPELAC